MTRVYRGRRNNERKDAVPFQVEYEDVVDVLDPVTQKPTGTKTSTWRTETFTCRGDISGLTLSDFAHQADVQAETPEGAAILRRVFTEAFGDAQEYRRFNDFAAKHLEDDQLIEIMSDLIEDFANRPTVSPSPLPPASATATEGSSDHSRVTSSPTGHSAPATIL